MAFLDNFNAANVEPSGSIQPIPAGEYLAIVKESEKRENKSRTGFYLFLKFELLAGPHKGRTINAYMNLWHNNAQTKEIAWSEMSALCRAIGIMTPKDSVELHNIPLLVEVGVGNPTADGKIYNEIQSYKKRDTSVAASEPANPPANPSGARPAWMGNRQAESPADIPSDTPF